MYFLTHFFVRALQQRRRCRKTRTFWRVDVKGSHSFPFKRRSRRVRGAFLKQKRSRNSFNNHPHFTRLLGTFPTQLTACRARSFVKIPSAAHVNTKLSSKVRWIGIDTDIHRERERDVSVAQLIPLHLVCLSVGKTSAIFLDAMRARRN